MSHLMTIGSVENPYSKTEICSMICYTVSNSTSKEKARKQAILKRKQQYGCIKPNDKKMAAEKKAEAKMAKEIK